MQKVVKVMPLLLLVSACGAANAQIFDSADDVTCAAVYGATAHGAQNGSNPGVLEELVPRIGYLAKTHGGADWIRQITPRSQQIALAIEASHDEARGMKLLKECMARQDADPGFRAAVPGAMPASAL